MPWTDSDLFFDSAKYSELEYDIEDSCDVVVIGSGAAGGTAARVFAENGLDVVILEEGPLVKAKEMRDDVYTGFKNIWREMGFQLAAGRAMMPVLQTSCVGGTTVVNSAIIHKLPKSVHTEWENKYGLKGVFPYLELERAWSILDKELHVTKIPDAARGNNNLMMHEAADKIGIKSNIMKRSIKGCEGHGNCLQGCPTERKQATYLNFVPYAVSRNARLYTMARAEQILNKNGRACGALAYILDQKRKKTGKKIKVEAKVAVVVAASAVHTPLLLKKNGIGKSSGLVGKRFQGHPATAVLGTFDKEVKMWEGATQGHESLEYWDKGLKLESLALPPELGAVRLPGLGRDLIEQLANYRYIAQWGMEIRSEAHGVVKKDFLGKTDIKFDPTNHDVRIVKKGIYTLCEMLFSLGAKKVFPGYFGIPEMVESMDPVKKIFDLPDDPRNLHCIMAHLFGTTLAGSDKNKSVLDLNLESHDLKNLFVVDSSFFPTNIGVNPQHAICGLAWLAAEKIVSRKSELRS